MNFCPGRKNSIQGKDRKMWQNYQRIMSLLQSFIDENRVNASFHEIQKITKMSFNIPLKLLPFVSPHPVTQHWSEFSTSNNSTLLLWCLLNRRMWLNMSNLDNRIFGWSAWLMYSSTEGPWLTTELGLLLFKLFAGNWGSPVKGKQIVLIYGEEVSTGSDSSIKAMSCAYCLWIGTVSLSSTVSLWSTRYFGCFWQKKEIWLKNMLIVL